MLFFCIIKQINVSVSFIDNTARRKVLYLSKVRSIFEHCPTVWRPSAYTATNKLETIQKRAIQRGGANTKVPDMYGGGGVFSGPKTQK